MVQAGPGHELVVMPQFSTLEATEELDGGAVPASGLKPEFIFIRTERKIQLLSVLPTLGAGVG